MGKGNYEEKQEANPHWTPVTESHLSVYNKPTRDVWLNTATPAMSLEVERRAERSFIISQNSAPLLELDSLPHTFAQRL